MMQADVVRPRVLLADDDAGMLKAISRTLATDFEVVATVTDGTTLWTLCPVSTPMLSCSTSRCQASTDFKRPKN